MAMSHCSRATTVALAFAAASPAHANSYTLVDLGTALYNIAVNDRGQVAGTAYHQYQPRALLWDVDHWHKLTRTDGDARAINAHGDVAGDLGDPDEQAAPAFWRAHHPILVLPLPGDATYGTAWGINDDDAVVGVYVLGNASRCFEWTDAGGTVDLGLMDNGDECGALAINASGQVTGWATTDGFLRLHTFRRSIDGNFQDLGSLVPQGRARIDFSEGFSINSAGDIVGHSLVHPVESHHSHAVLWRGTRLIDLNRGSEFGSSEAYAINDAGDIVGFADDNKIMYGVRFTNPGVVKLDDEVTNIGRWHVEWATGLSPKGDIVARAIGPTGQEHTVLLRLESRD